MPKISSNPFKKIADVAGEMTHVHHGGTSLELLRSPRIKKVQNYMQKHHIVFEPIVQIVVKLLKGLQHILKWTDPEELSRILEKIINTLLWLMYK